MTMTVPIWYNKSIKKAQWTKLKQYFPKEFGRHDDYEWLNF